MLFSTVFILYTLNANEISLLKYTVENLVIAAILANSGGKTLTESLLNFMMNCSKAREKMVKFMVLPYTHQHAEL